MQKIVIFVLMGHLLFLLILLQSPDVPPIEVPKKFAVKTISLRGEIEQIASSAPVVMNSSTAKKTPAAKKEGPKVVKQEAKAAQKVQKNEALAKAKKALKDLTANAAAKTTLSMEKGAIGSLHIEGVEGDSYISELVAKLQKSLKLPEFGEVVVELTLEKSGKVVSWTIKEAKSLTNKMYVEKTLPSLKFPIFEGSLKHEAAHTFIFVLNSVD